MMGFEQLMDELEGLQKSMSADEGSEAELDEDGNPIKKEGDGDDAIQAAAESEGAGDADTDKEEGMSKSFKIKTDDGEEIEAYNGEELIKSFEAKLQSQEENTGKVMGVIVDLTKSLAGTVTAQKNLIKSLEAKVDDFLAKGKGRKTVVSIQEKTATGDLAKSLETEKGIDLQEFRGNLKKALSTGKIDALEATRTETQLNSGIQPDAAIVAKVMDS